MKNRNRWIKTGMLVLCIVVLCCGCSGLQKKEHVLEEGKAASIATDAMADSSVLIEKEEAVSEESSGESRNELKITEVQEDSDIIYVDVCGQVKYPGVYRLSANSRVYQAIEMAGGMSKNAAATAVNQAEPLADGQQIYVPSKDEVKNQTGVTTSVSGGEANSSSIESKKDLININTASKEELMSLSGIGDAKADSIVKYRESIGPFSCIEDIMNVDGIGEGVFGKLKDSITVS